MLLPGIDTGADFKHQLAPSDHLAPRVHTVKILYFKTDEASNEIFTTLRDATSKSIAAFPIMGGSVSLLKGAKTGTLAVQAPFYSVRETLFENDLHDTYNYEDLRARNFPPDAVDFDLVVPNLPSNSSRVCLLQGNTIRGGFILTVSVHHNVSDEAGIFVFMKLLSAYCRGEDGSALIKPEWTDNSAIMHGEGTGLLDDHPEYSRRLRKPEDSATLVKQYEEFFTGTTGVTDTTATAVIFFGDDALAQVKKAATKENASVDGNQQAGNWISTSDALCAFIWTSVTRARELGPEVPFTMFNMTVNGRSRFNPPLSPDYMGNVVFITTRALLPPAPLLSPAFLPDAALTIRNSIQVINHAAMMDKIKAVDSVDDIGRLAPGRHASWGQHLACTSWAGQPYYTLNWGKSLGGAAKRVRCQKDLSNGFMVMFARIPSNKNDEDLGPGGLEVQIGLGRDVMARLKKDEVFGQYAQWRCLPQSLV